MVVAVVLVSFIKPMAFSRYFVVLLPAAVPVLAVVISRLELNRLGHALSLGVGAHARELVGPGFAELDGVGGVREQDQFRLISQRAGGLTERYSPRPVFSTSVIEWRRPWVGSRLHHLAR